MINRIDKALAQQIVDTVQDVCGKNINFIDCSGIIFASTDKKRIGSYHEIGHKAAASGTIIEVKENERYSGTQEGINLPVYHNQKILAVIGITGNPEEVRKYAYLAEKVTSLLIREKELDSYSQNQAEKRHFAIQTLISTDVEEMPYLEDSLNEFGIDIKTDKRMILIQLCPGYSDRSSADNLPLEHKLMQMYRMLSIRLYTFQYPNQYLALVDEPIFRKHASDLEKFAKTHRQFFKIAVGKACPIFHLNESWTSAVTAMKSIFESENDYVSYDDLALDIILVALDSRNKEEFTKKMIAKLEAEDLRILKTYFEEDMSLKGTCEKLYLHKNTLQYKLNRIYQVSGYNPRKFKDAVLLYLAVKMSGNRRE